MFGVRVQMDLIKSPLRLSGLSLSLLTVSHLIRT